MTDRPVIDQWYVVIKGGAKLHGWQYAGQSSFRSVGCDLEVQDRLLYLGARTIGSDSFPEDYFRCERTNIEGALSHGSWGSADMTYLQRIEENEGVRFQQDCESIIRTLKGAGLDAGVLHPMGVEVGDEHWDMMIDEDLGVWRVGLYPVIDNVVSDEALIMREVFVPDRGGSDAGGTHVENHISRLLDVTDAALEVWAARNDRRAIAGAILDQISEMAPAPAADALVIETDADGGVSVCPHCNQPADEDEDGLHYCPRCDLALDHFTEDCDECATEEVKMFVAQYSGSHYDGFAIGATEDEAREALVTEWDRQFPDNEMTPDDWADSISVYEVGVGQAVIC